MHFRALSLLTFTLCSCAVSAVSLEDWLEPKTSLSLEGEGWGADDEVAVERACTTWNQALNSRHRCSVGTGGRIHLFRMTDPYHGHSGWFPDEHTFYIWEGLNPRDVEVVAGEAIGLLNGLNVSDEPCGIMNPEPDAGCLGVLSKQDIQLCRESGSCD